MASNLYKVRWLLVCGFVGFGLAFAGIIHQGVDSGVSVASKGDVYVLVGVWWAALICLYLFWFASTFAGKNTNSSTVKKAVMMLLPSMFVIFSVFVTGKFVTGF